MASALSDADERYSDDFLRTIFEEVKTIAVVGLSANPLRPSRIVFEFLRGRGYKVVGVNPGLAGKEIDGAPVYARLADIPIPIDMVDIFRNSAAAGQIVDDALALSPKPKVIWMQLDVRNDRAAQKARAEGLRVVMNRCPHIEIPRLM
ncbi:MAG: CoA-binding protein [Methylovirgula sp.]|jgi:predicted CoA-binding protein